MNVLELVSTAFYVFKRYTYTGRTKKQKRQRKKHTGVTQHTHKHTHTPSGSELTIICEPHELRLKLSADQTRDHWWWGRRERKRDTGSKLVNNLIMRTSCGVCKTWAALLVYDNCVCYEGCKWLMVTVNKKHVATVKNQEFNTGTLSSWCCFFFLYLYILFYTVHRFAFHAFLWHTCKRILNHSLCGCGCNTWVTLSCWSWKQTHYVSLFSQETFHFAFCL